MCFVFVCFRDDFFRCQMNVVVRDIYIYIVCVVGDLFGIVGVFIQFWFVDYEFEVMVKMVVDIVDCIVQIIEVFGYV